MHDCILRWSVYLTSSLHDTFVLPSACRVTQISSQRCVLCHRYGFVLLLTSNSFTRQRVALPIMQHEVIAALCCVDGFAMDGTANGRMGWRTLITHSSGWCDLATRVSLGQ